MSEKIPKKRLASIRKKLKRGDIKQIALIAKVHPVWVSYVLAGKGTSEPVLLSAEQYIRNKEKEKYHNRIL